MDWLAAALSLWLLLVTGLALAFRRPLLALWREPVLRWPVLIVESDDWGAGPAEQVQALAELADLLERQRDGEGHPAVMTLAVILALPEPGEALRLRPMSPEVRSAIRAGMARGVFAPQLHGLCHYWPESLARAADSRPEVRAWLAAPELTEKLPSPLQSRWVDASTLPAQALPDTEVATAVAEETRRYAELFEAPPEVVVPPTFVWNESVEAAWARAGVRVVVTPGRRLTGRDAEGRPAYADRSMLNGEAGAGGIRYLVRDDYFEPMFGHTPALALAALQQKTALGRPCLLETHRSNFLSAAGGDPAAALAALDALYRQALEQFPDLRFTSCAELARAMAVSAPAWIEQDAARRFTIRLERIRQLPRFARAARLLGLFSLLSLFAQST